MSPSAVTRWSGGASETVLIDFQLKIAHAMAANFLEYGVMFPARLQCRRKTTGGSKHADSRARHRFVYDVAM